MTHHSVLTNELSAFTFLKGNRRVIKVTQSLQFNCRAELIAWIKKATCFFEIKMKSF